MPEFTTKMGFAADKAKAISRETLAKLDGLLRPERTDPTDTEATTYDPHALAASATAIAAQNIVRDNTPPEKPTRDEIKAQYDRCGDWVLAAMRAQRIKNAG